MAPDSSSTQDARGGRESRRAWPVLAALLALVASAPGQASEPPVRVLLARDADRIEVETPQGARRVVARSEGLVVDGRPVGRYWTLPGPGPYRAGGLRVDGALRVERSADGLLAVAAVPLEDYVASTVGREMPSGWAPEALRAQAIVSRTYAVRARLEPAHPAYDVEASTVSQVFGGTEGIADSVRTAVAATRGRILVHAGQPIVAAFHSASGGRTASAEEVWGKRLPYLRSQPVDGEEDAPSTYWRATVSRLTLGRALGQLGLGVGRVEGLEVAERGPSGRVRRLVVRGERGSHSISGRLLRSTLGEELVKSTLFEVRGTDAEIVLVGSGHGHGVGMSQWGARAMAARGVDHAAILAAFYPGAVLVNTNDASSPRLAARAGSHGAKAGSER